MTDEIRTLLAQMRAARLETAIKNEQITIRKMQNAASARGTARSGGFRRAVADTVVDIFKTAYRGLLIDYVAVAGDVRSNADELTAFESDYMTVIVGTRGGLEDRLAQFLGLEPAAKDAARGEADRAIVTMKRDASIVFRRERLRQGAAASMARGAATDRPVPSGTGEQRDFFISHAGEDRQSFVEALVSELVQRGKTVWYSEYEITLGDSLRQRIDDGLSRSHYGVVVLSPAFFEKPWARAELDALANRAQLEDRKIVLPIWHNIGIEELVSRSPLLAGVAGIPSSRGIFAVVDAILGAVDVAK